LNAGTWFLIASYVIGVVCALAGVIVALRAGVRVKKHANAIIPRALVARLELTAVDASRLQGCITLIEALVPRAKAALDESALALRELRRALSFER
jgi:hypothetical protein